MALYAIVDNGGIVEYRELAEAPKLDGKPYRKVLPVVDTDPAWDPATQTRTGPVVTVKADHVARVWAVVDRPAEEIEAERGSRIDEIAAQFDRGDDIVRFAVLVIMDELNLHSDRLASVLQAAAGASSLAAFKTAMAAIPPIPRRTAAQLRAAIRAKMDG